MVKFIPPYMGEEIKSNAERKMYDVLQQLNMKNAVVLHSLGLPKHESKIYGEIDFVVVCDLGVACLEIKGGRVECRDGKWIFTDRYGTAREKPEGPFAQVIGNMFSIRELLKKKFPSNRHMKNLLVASGVVFPDIKFNSNSEEIIPEIIYDNATDDITEYIKGVFNYWKERQHREPSKLSPNDINEVVNYLRGDFVFLPTLSDRLNDVEERLVRLTADQVTVMDALSENTHLLIEGNAGTGKTLLAIDFARKKAAADKKVLYLTYNKNLARKVDTQISKTDNLKVINIHALFGEYVKINVDELNENPQKYFSEILPERFYDYINGIDLGELENIQYDVLVMDEGQDIIKPIYLYCLDSLLKGGLEKGEWSVFYDEKQNIYNPEYYDGMDILQGYNYTKFKLYINCRNTVQIGKFSSQISGINMGEFLKENGEEVQKITFSGTDDLKKKIKDIMKYLQGQQVDLQDIVFLTPKKYKNSMLADIGLEVNELGDKYDNSKNLPIYATIQGFKGLDSKIVILTDVEHIRKQDFSKFLYIAGTRARTLLYVVASEKFYESINKVELQED